MIYLFFGLFSILFIVIEIFQKRIFTQINWARKATHIGSGIIAFFLPLYLSQLEIIILAGTFTIILSVSQKKQILFLHNVSRKTLGEIFFPIAIGILAIFFTPNSIPAFQFGILVLTFSDSAAEIIGTTFPIKQYKNSKSIGGIGAFFIITFIICLFSFPPQTTIITILGISLILSSIEFVLKYGLDNLFIPVASAFLYTYVLL